MKTIRVLSLADLDAELRQEWRELASERDANPSLDPGWTRVIGSTIGRARAPIHVWTLRESGQLRAAIPFFRTRQRMLGVPMRTLELASNLMSYHAELVTRDGCERTLSAFLDHHRDWDVFRASNVPLESETARAIGSVADRLRSPLRLLAGDASPYLPIRCSWNDYLATRHKKFRYKLRKRGEELQNNADFQLRWFASERDCEALFDAILAIERRSWKTSAAMDISSREVEAEYHRELLPYLAREGALVAVVLYVGPRPIAYSLCASIRGWFGHLKTSFDDEFAAVSAGGIVIDASIERAFASGAREFDFLGHDAPHKLAWTDTLRRHADHLLFAPTLKPRLVSALKDFARAGRARLRMDTPRD